MEISLIITLVMVSLMLPRPIQAIDPLSEALLSLKSEIGDNSKGLDDWLLPSEATNTSALQIHACSWSGVKCSENSSKIIGLDLSMKKLGGPLSGKQFSLFLDLVELNLSHNSFSDQLPTGIFDLAGLKSLDISRNNFSGDFPSGISNLQSLVVLDAFSNSFSGLLPADVSKIKSLKVLNFAGSYFSGPIPSDYGSFEALEFIHLAGNFLSGSIPSDLGKLQTLAHMEIGYNSYEGGIPWEFGNMSGLVYLDIADANVSGPIPQQLSNLTKLESIFLFRNQLSGKIPDDFSKIMNLKSLDLSDNLLSGPIPESFSDLKNLKLLSLMYNDLSGSVPQGIAQLPELDTLLIWNNYFTGSLPEDLGRFSRLKHLDVSTNYFVGNIPPGICAQGELLRLILFSNNFTGNLFPSLSNCPSLIRLRLEDNSFSGDISSLPFDKMPDISYVDLSENRLSGGVPSQIDQASGLQYFNVSYNPGIGGILPVNIWSLPNLQKISLTSCGLSGTIPLFQSCKSLSVLELRTNNISGVISNSLANCKQLVRIDFAFNNLSGSIPLELAGLPLMSELDLSHNGFNGSIPPEFGNSSSLKLLNVSYNNISGSIPSSKAFKLMNESAFLGNSDLCGSPLTKPCSHREKEISNGLELGSRRAQKLAWVLVLCAVIVLLIAASVFGLMYYKKGHSRHWKMISFLGLPNFTAKDVLRSFDSVKTLHASRNLAVLPTGIPVYVKKIEFSPKEEKFVIQVLTKMGNIRHKNLTRLLGVCHANNVAYLLYDCMHNGNLAEKIGERRGWQERRRIVTGIASALCFLHHECYPAIPHGDLKAENVVLDENMEPRLVEYGLGSIARSIKATGFRTSTVGDELHADVYNFGELALETVTNGKSKNLSARDPQNTDNLVRETAEEDGIGQFKEEIQCVVDVALLCKTSRPSMQHVVKMLSGLRKSQSN